MIGALPSDVPGPPPAHSAGVRRAWPALLIVLWAAASAIGWDLSLNNDVSWQYWVARQLMAGSRFYRDIVESNPPLWFWEAMPLTVVADALHVAPRHLAVAWVMARIALAVALVVALSPAGRLRRAAGAAIGLIGLTIFDFGERDPLMAIGAIPYALLLAARADRHEVGRPLAIATALPAALGFALKPHFILIPLALEGWLALRSRRAYRMVRAETVALVALLGLYAAATAIVAPEYFARQLPLVLAAYGDFRPPFASLWLGQVYLPCWIAGGIVILLARKSVEASGAAVATAAFVLIYAAQGKGFPYQAVPVTIGVCWTCWLVLERERRLLVRAGAILTIGMALSSAIMIGPFKPSRLGTITARVEALPAGATFAVISAHSWDAFPLAEDRRLLWPMRGLLLWTMPAIARDENTPLARTTRAEIVADLWCHPPDAILFDDPARSPAMPRNGFDYLRFVAADRSARALLSSYRPVEREGGASLWMRRMPVTPRGADCRRITVRPDHG